MALTKEQLITAIDYWNIEKVKFMDALEDLIEETIDDEPNLRKLNEMTSVSKSLDDIDLVIRRINELLIKSK